MHNANRENGMGLPNDLKEYRPSEDAFQILDTNAAAVWFVIVFALGCILQWCGVI